MTAKELRVGNILEYHGQQVIVLEIKRNSAEFGYFNDSIGFERLYTDSDFPKPLDIKREHLLHFGFEEKTILRYDKEPLALCGGAGGMHISFFEYGDGAYGYSKQIYVGNPINYVHQLQNLYFVLTGTELTKSN